MNAEKLRKMFRSGDSTQVRKACNELMDRLAKLERDVAALEAQGPIIYPATSYRAVEKGDDDPFVR